jgi:hypothetical protein
LHRRAPFRRAAASRGSYPINRQGVTLTLTYPLDQQHMLPNELSLIVKLSIRTRTT